MFQQKVALAYLVAVIGVALIANAMHATTTNLALYMLWGVLLVWMAQLVLQRARERNSANAATETQPPPPA